MARTADAVSHPLLQLHVTAAYPYTHRNYLEVLAMKAADVGSKLPPRPLLLLLLPMLMLS
jgi:hypothetical protein